MTESSPVSPEKGISYRSFDEEILSARGLGVKRRESGGGLTEGQLRGQKGSPLAANLLDKRPGSITL
jgi:hypothetical protein